MKHTILWFLVIPLLLLLLLSFVEQVEAVKNSDELKHCNNHYPIVKVQNNNDDDQQTEKKKNILRRNKNRLLLDVGRYRINRGGGRESSGDTVDGSSSKMSSSLSSKSKATTTTTTPIVEGLKNSLASGLASCCAKMLLQPFDTIKTMQQHYKTTTGSSSIVDDHHRGLSLIEAYQLVTERGGFQQLYAGLVVSALGSVPSIGLYYGIYSYCKRILIPFFQQKYGSCSNASDNENKNNNKNNKKNLLSDDQLKWIAIMISAAIGNTIASFSRVPYEVVKQKLQTGIYPTTWIAITTMFHENGIIGGFFPTGGVWIQMLRDIPYAIFTLLSYEILRDKWVNKQQRKHKSPWHDMIAGAIAGGIGSYMTNGLDVIKTRIQINPELYDNGSIINCIQATWEEGGYRAFMRGSIPRLLHKIPANGSFFLFYEFFRRLLRVGDASTNN